MALDQVTTQQVAALLVARWGGAAASTYNRHRAALLAFFGWCVDHGYLTVNPATGTGARKLRKRSEHLRRERPLAREHLTRLRTIGAVGGRDRLLWRMAFETWARANELLGLNIADLNLATREAVVRGKGGDAEAIYWSTGTARLLPRVIAGRTRGPLFVATRLPTRAMPLPDLDDTGHARLSYRRAQELFRAVGRRIDPDTVWTLHRLRHTGITQAVEAGWNLAQIRAKSRHSSLRSLQIYTNPSPDNVRHMTALLDPETR